jgi:hypothetical protein
LKTEIELSVIGSNINSMADGRGLNPGRKGGETA